MKKRILATILALCLCLSSKSAAYTEQEGPFIQGNAPMGEAAFGAITRDSTVPTPQEAYQAMTALQSQDAYKEGTTWTNEEPYSDTKGCYYWNGGNLGGSRIAAVGCVAFAFILSDAAFGSLPARMYAAGSFAYTDIKVGDILRVNNDAHTVIVLEVSDAGVVVAEGNISTGEHQGKVHWGRVIAKEAVMSSTSHYITRYPENYIPPDDPDANVSIASGTMGAGLTWNLTQAGTLTISGSGAMPDFADVSAQPWSQYSSQIRKAVIGDGITRIGSGAFMNSGVLSAEISSSVRSIGNNAFLGSSMIAVSIPSSVKVIGDGAFRECKSLSTVTIAPGLEVIGQNAFRSCTSLTSIALPASIGEVGAAAFWQCTELRNVSFASGSSQVKMGDNMFMQCYNLMGVQLPQNIDRISEGMFQNCLMLAGVEIPQGAESIGANAFSSCSGMTAVVIPHSVTTIGIAAFASCPLKDIYFTGTEEQWNKIQKLGDTSQTVLKATIHYNYVPPAPGPGPDDGDDSAGDNSGGTGSGSDNSTGDNSGGTGSGSDNSTGGNTGGTGSGSGNNPGGSTGNGNRPGISGGTQGGSQTGSGTYRILKGTEGLWKVNADGSVTISADGELADFDHLEIDGKSVDPSNYTLKSGSTIVTLKAEFLKTLGQGNHTVTFVYKDGQVSMTLPYGKDGVPSGMAAPKTGEERIPLARAALLLLLAAWIAIIYRKGKKESAGRQA